MVFAEQYEAVKSSAPAALRQQAWERFGEVGFPTVRQEAWKKTNPAPIVRTSFGAPDTSVSIPADLPSFLWDDAAACLVFVNGTLRSSKVPAGLALRSLMDVADVVGTVADIECCPFTALNTALFKDGASLELTANQILEDPIFIVFLTVGSDTPVSVYPRLVVHLQRLAQATLVEVHAGVSNAAYFSDPVVEGKLEEGAQLRHYRFTLEGREGLHVGRTRIQQARDSRYESCTLTRGGRMVRHDLEVVLDGEGAECELNGLYRMEGDSHVDHHTLIDHARPHCTSNEFYKGIMDGRSTGVFVGRVVVRKQAQKTNAAQKNQNLILSNEATVDTQPQLEILADDVKCAHGATVGQLEQDALFYLRARGLDVESARALLTMAFANDVLDTVEPEALRNKVRELMM